MLKKSFVPARIVQGVRWYLEWKQLHPVTGELVRFRETFDLNRIKNLAERRQQASELKKWLNREQLPAGYPFESLQKDDKGRGVVSLEDAIARALSVKQELPRLKSYRTFESKARALLEFLKEQKWLRRPVEEFERHEARQFLKWIEHKRNICGTTYNNYVEKLRSLWNEMMDDGIVKQNPWSKIRMRPEEEKIRRVMSEAECRHILEWLRANDYVIYLACLLQYYCFIRPSELRRLRRCDLDFKRGVIILPAAKTKMHRKRFATIPASLLSRFEAWRDLPANYFLFGARGVPNAIHAASENYLYNHHRRCIETLHRQGLIQDLYGLHFYSWKDTGITELSKRVSLYRLRDQVGHSSFDMILKYYHQNELNEEMQQLEIRLS